MRRLVPLVCVTVGMAGCGGSAADKEAIRNVGAAYFKAVARGDSRAACALLVPDPRDRVDQEGVCDGKLEKEQRDQRLSPVTFGNFRFAGRLVGAVASFPDGLPKREVAFKKYGTKWRVKDTRPFD